MEYHFDLLFPYVGKLSNLIESLTYYAHNYIYYGLIFITTIICTYYIILWWHLYLFNIILQLGGGEVQIWFEFVEWYKQIAINYLNKVFCWDYLLIIK